MSDEVKIVEEKEPKCFCQSKGFRKFLVIALGTFVGVYSALCLFTALHKPMMPPCPCQGQYGGAVPFASPCPFKRHHGHFDRDYNGDRGEFHKQIKQNSEPAPFEKR